jgi:hypothetical protein
MGEEQHGLYRIAAPNGDGWVDMLMVNILLVKKR